MQQLDEQRVFMMLDTNVKLVKEGEDFYIYCMNDKKAHFYNCKGISEAFLEEMLECYREVLAEDGYDVIEEVEEIDLNELLDQQIKDGVWDWRKEVKEYIGHEGIEGEKM